MVNRVSAGKLTRTVELWRYDPGIKDAAGQTDPDTAYRFVGKRRASVLPAPNSGRESLTTGRLLALFTHTIRLRYDRLTRDLRARDEIRYRREGALQETRLHLLSVQDPAEERRVIDCRAIETELLDRA